VEVFSESTERYDRDGKFQAYKRLSSLQEYVFVSQDEKRIEVYRLAQGAWIVETSGAGGSVTIHGARIEVDAVYD
jgi:Uma2 family endonuclease